MTTPRESRHPTLASWLENHRAALGLLCLSPTVMLWRVLSAPSTRLPGLETGDVYKHTWAFWHLLAQLGDGSWPRTPYLNHPEGGVLLDVMAVPALLMVPVTARFGPVLAANLWIWISLVATGLACYHLTLRTSRDRVGAVAAGVLVQSSPFLLGHALASGVLERLQLWVFPVLVLGLLAARRPRASRILAVAVATAIATLQCPTYGTYLGVLGLALTLALLLVPGTRSRAHDLAGIGAQLGAVALALGAVLLLHRAFVHSPDFLAGIPQGRVTATLGVSPGRFEVATLRTLFDPLTVRQQQPKRIDDELWLISYVGWAWAAVVAVGGWAALRRKRWLPLAVLAVALLFLALALGPKLAVAGHALENPFFFAVAQLVPFYGGMPAPWQQVGVFAALSGVALGELSRALPSEKARVPVMIAVVAAVLVERALVLPVPVMPAAAGARIDAVYGEVTQDGGLVDLPHLWRDTELFSGLPFLAQTLHRRPIPWAINVGESRWDDYAPLQRGTASDWRPVGACLRARGYRWLAVHPDWYGAELEAQAALGSLREGLGPEVARGESLVLFDLERAPSAALPADCPSPDGLAEQTP